MLPTASRRRLRAFVPGSPFSDLVLESEVGGATPPTTRFLAWLGKVFAGVGERFHANSTRPANQSHGAGHEVAFPHRLASDIALRTSHFPAFAREPSADWTLPRLSPSISPVPNANKPAGSPHPATAPVAFEEALQKLELIVEAMESESLPLETLIQRYEDGVKLVQVCQEKLAGAELKIQQLEKSAAGQFRLKPLAVEAAEH